MYIHILPYMYVCWVELHTDIPMPHMYVSLPIYVWDELHIDILMAHVCMHAYDGFNMDIHIHIYMSSMYGMS